MVQHYFISYSSVDAQDFALSLCDELQSGPPIIRVWLDKRDLKPSRDWDEQIAEAIKGCKGLIFIMTPDSVETGSVCKQEWIRALKYKKPVIPLLLDKNAEMPFRLEPRQYIDFTNNFESSLARLRKHIQWLDSPEGELQVLKDRLADAKRDVRRAKDEEKPRIQDEINFLNSQIEEKRRISEDREAAKKRTEESIERGMERERKPEKPIRIETSAKFINPAPVIPPTYFQNREPEIRHLIEFLRDDSSRMMTIVGRSGIGKTALVCLVLKSLEKGKLPYNMEPFSMDGIIYLNQTGSRRINSENLFSDLCKLVPGEKAQNLLELFKNPKLTTQEKMQKLALEFSDKRVAVLLDNFEDIINPETLEIKDIEISEALISLLKIPHHGIKIILTTRIPPHNLQLVEPGRQTHITLDQGLDSPFAENILRAMDVDGKLGLKNASEELLDKARIRTKGYPRALEALFAILAADRHTTLEELLEKSPTLLPEVVVKAMVGEAFIRLDPTAQRVMETLAIYGRPVSATAVDYLLNPHVPGINSSPVLNRLVNMHFARKKAGRYYLHPVDRAYSLENLPMGEDRDIFDETENGKTPYTRIALLSRAAGYFREIRKPREEWKCLEDLSPQLSEFDLRCEAGDWETAADVLLEIAFDYLLLWGYYTLSRDIHLRLEGNLEDPDQQGACCTNLGLCYYSLGEIQKAIGNHEQALSISREIGNRKGESNDLGNLGLCYYDLGGIQKAIENHEQALSISREIGNRNGESADLGNLGNCYNSLGEIQKAIKNHEKALSISREIGYREGESNDLGNLGLCYYSLGDIQKAIQYHEKALSIDREIGSRNGESSDLGSLAYALILDLRFEDALDFALKSVEIAEEIKNPYLCSCDGTALALAFLCMNDLSCAREAAKGSCKHDIPLINYSAFSLLGLIALIQNDPEASEKAFLRSISEADKILEKCGRYYTALYSKGFAFSGLALICERNEQESTNLENNTAINIQKAVESYTSAKSICFLPGVLKKQRLLLNKLSLCHPNAAEILKPILSVISERGTVISEQLSINNHRSLLPHQPPGAFAIRETDGDRECLRT